VDPAVSGSTGATVRLDPAIRTTTTRVTATIEFDDAVYAVDLPRLVRESVFGANVTAVTIVSALPQCVPIYDNPGIRVVHLAMTVQPDSMVSVVVPPGVGVTVAGFNTTGSNNASTFVYAMPGYAEGARDTLKILSIMTVSAQLAASAVGSYLIGFRWSISTPPGASLLHMMGHLQLAYFVSTLSVKKMPYGVIEVGSGLKWATLVGDTLYPRDVVNIVQDVTPPDAVTGSPAGLVTAAVSPGPAERRRLRRALLQANTTANTTASTTAAPSPGATPAAQNTTGTGNGTGAPPYTGVYARTPSPEVSAVSPTAGVIYATMEEAGGFDAATMRYTSAEDALGATATYVCILLFCVVVMHAGLWLYVKRVLMKKDHNIRMPAILQPPRLELMVAVVAAPGMAAVSFRNAYYGGVSGQVAGAFVLILHPIALVLAVACLLRYHVMSNATDTVTWQDVDEEPAVASRIKVKNLHRVQTWKLRGEWVDAVVDSGALDRWGVLFEEYLPDTYGIALHS
jgi:hypothetical protein